MSLLKCEVFGLMVQAYKSVKKIGFKWVLWKKKGKNETISYKAQLVVKHFLKDLVLIIQKHFFSNECNCISILY